MASVWMWSLVAVLLVSAISLVGAILLVFTERQISRVLLFLVSLAAGGMFGDAFLHLLPVAYSGSRLRTAIFALMGILCMFALEKLLQWQHSHYSGSAKPFGYVNLVADGIHNFIDGVLIASSFLVSWPIGISTSLAVILHEVPQEIGDFAVLIRSGFSPRTALLANVASASVAILGTSLTLIVGNEVALPLDPVLSFTAGAFIYVAGADLIPELQQERRPLHSVLQLVGLISGIGIMTALLALGG